MPQTEQYWIDVYGKVALTGEPFAYQNYARELGKYYDAFAFRPEPGQFAVVFTDITERKRAEDSTSRRANRALQAISACNQAIVRAESEGELLSGICEAIATAGPYPLTWIGYKGDDAQRTVQPMAWAGPVARQLQPMAITWADTPAGQSPAGKAVRTGRTHVLQNLREDPDYQLWWHTVAEQGFASCIGIPLRIEGAVIGMLGIYGPETDAFDHEEQRLLEGLADDLAYGVAALRVRADRERAIKTVRSSEIRFRATFEQAAVGMILVGARDETLDVNDRLCEILGFSREELLSRHWRDVTYPEDMGRSEQQHALINHGLEHRYLYEKRFVRKDGAVSGRTSVHLRSTMMPGCSSSVSVPFRIVRRRSRPSWRWRRLRNGSGRCLSRRAWVLRVSDAAGNWQLVNACLAELLGYASQELEGHHYREFIHPEEREADERLDQHIRAGLVPRLEVENRYLHRSGHVVWMRVSMGSIMDAAGTFQGAVSILQDVSARKQAEEAVRQAAAANALLAAAVENTSVGVVVTNATLPENPSSTSIKPTCRSPGTRSTRCSDATHDSCRAKAPALRCAKHSKTQWQGGRALRQYVLNYRKDGTPIWNEVRITPIIDAAGTCAQLGRLW